MKNFEENEPCHQGKRHDMVFTLNHVYPGVKIIEHIDYGNISEVFEFNFHPGGGSTKEATNKNFKLHGKR